MVLASVVTEVRKSLRSPAGIPWGAHILDSGICKFREFGKVLWLEGCSLSNYNAEAGCQETSPLAVTHELASAAQRSDALAHRNKNEAVTVSKCPVCAKLWEEYTQATREQLSLMVRMPALNQDFAQVQQLEEQIEAAAENRERAWQRIMEHEQRFHGTKARDA